MSRADAGPGFFGALRSIPRKALTSFQNFKRSKERENQRAVVFDFQGAKSIVLSGALSPAVSPRGSVDPFSSISRPPGWNYENADDEKFDNGQQIFGNIGNSRCSSATPDLWRPSRCSTSTPDQWRPSRCSSATPMSPSPELWSARGGSPTVPDTPDLLTFSSIGSRPGTRQGTRGEDAQLQLIESKNEMEDDEFVAIVLREKLKRQYWDSYEDAENPKKVLSDFEEYMRKLHDDVENEEIQDVDMKNCMAGFTARTPRQELVSAYATQCRESYSLPLGPRGTVGLDAQDNSAAQLASSEMLLYSGWSLGSDRVDLLCNTSLQGMRNCKHINLSGNRIEDRSIGLICKELLPTIETLDLSKNLLSHQGARNLADAIKARRVRSPLLELNLAGNLLSDKPHTLEWSQSRARSKHGRESLEDDVCALIIALADLCPWLQALCLADNGLGKVDGAVGGALGHLVRSASKLKVLDLHWNHFGGVGAYQLLMGVYDNGQQKKNNGQYDGNLSRIDLSFNRLGYVDPAHPNAVPAKVLADVLEDHKRLFHLDISYNQLGMEACQHLANGIKHNQTLLGFHVAGNAAALDANGFLVPHENPSGIENPMVIPETLSFPDPSTAQRRKQRGRKGLRRHTQKNFTRFFETGPSSAISADQHAVQLGQHIGEHPLSILTWRSECCWICDRWRPTTISWTPGVSGPLPENEVDSVNIFLSIDSFKRPTPLTKTAGTLTEREIWQTQVMLPPGTQVSPFLVIFQVNGSLECARDLPTRIMPQAVQIEGAGGADVGMPGSLDTTNGGVSTVNEVPVKEEDAHNHGPGRFRQPLVVTEDHVEQGKMRVAPRNVTATGPKGKRKWTKVVSVWATWVEEDENLFEKMIDFDLSLTKVSKFLGDVSLYEVAKAILPYYGPLMSTYRHLVGQGTGHAVFGVSYNTLVTMGNKSDLFDDALSSKTIVNHSIAACVIDKQQAGKVKIRADNVIVRYQFVETFIRAAHSKYVLTERADNLCDAIDKLFAEMDDYMADYHQELQEFRRTYFVEEVDMVFRNYMHLLHALYALYTAQWSRGASNGMMSQTLWAEFLHDCEGFDDKFVKRKASQAFLFGVMWHVDEVSTERHMHMNFAEFLVAIGAVIFMRRFWHEEEFADLIEDFIEENLVPLWEARSSPEQKEALAAKVHKQHADTGRPFHISKAELRVAFENVFRIADEDDDGVLTLREFRNAFRNPKVVSVLGGGTCKVEECIKVFDSIDDDHNNVLTVDEAMVGFAAIRRLEMTGERAKAFLENICKSVAQTGEVPLKSRRGTDPLVISPSLSDAPTVRGFDFLVVVHRPATQRKLMRVSLDPADVYKYFASMAETETLFEIDTLVSELMKLRTDKHIPRWKIALKQVFEDADVDMSGTLTKKEWVNELRQPGVAAKFDKVGIAACVIETWFDFLDTDEDHTLTEIELVDGFTRLLGSGAGWAKDEKNQGEDEDEDGTEQNVHERKGKDKKGKKGKTGKNKGDPKPKKMVVKIRLSVDDDGKHVEDEEDDEDAPKQPAIARESTSSLSATSRKTLAKRRSVVGLEQVTEHALDSNRKKSVANVEDGANTENAKDTSRRTSARKSVGPGTDDKPVAVDKKRRASMARRASVARKG